MIRAHRSKSDKAVFETLDVQSPKRASHKQSKWDVFFPYYAGFSGIASTFYVALFSICRDLVARFRSSNPTWIKLPKQGDRKVWVKPERLSKEFLSKVQAMSAALLANKIAPPDLASAEIYLADATKPLLFS